MANRGKYELVLCLPWQATFEIIEQVYLEIKNYGHEEQKKKLIAGIVLTGGGSQLKHLKQLVEYITGMDTRVGYPNEHLAGDTDKEVTIPLYATAVGLVLDGLKRFDKDISEKVEVKETDNENSDQGEDQPEQESVVRKDRPTILESFKDKLTEFLDNAE